MPILSDATVTPWTSAAEADPNFPNQTTTVWTEPTGESTSYRLLKHGIQPADEETLERAGLQSAVGLYTLLCEPVDLAPEGRVRVAGALHNGDFRVLLSREWHNHTQALLEQL